MDVDRKGVTNFILEHYKNKVFFTTRGMVSDFLIEKNYRLNTMSLEEQEMRKSLTSTATYIMKGLLRSKKIIKHNSNTYRVIKR